jgi:hypothetical protein
VPLSEMKSKAKLYLQVESKEHYKTVRNDIFRYLENAKGNNEFILYSKLEKSKIIIQYDFGVNIDNKSIINELITLLGEENVIIR